MLGSRGATVGGEMLARLDLWFVERGERAEET